MHVIVDYAIWYPESVPHQKATSHNIIKELVNLFSQIEVPKDLLTGQGMPFVTKLMSDLHWLLKVKKIRTSLYHPQAVKRFN